MRLTLFVCLAAGSAGLPASDALATTSESRDVIPVSALVGVDTLSRRGTGLSTRFRIPICTVALYVPDRLFAPDEVVRRPEPRRILLRLHRGLRMSDFATAIELTAERLPWIGAEGRGMFRRTINDVVREMPDLRDGDVLTLDWVPRSGVQIRLNGRLLIPPVPSEEVYQILVGFWVGEHSNDLSLSRRLLGQTDIRGEIQLTQVGDANGR